MDHSIITTYYLREELLKVPSGDTSCRRDLCREVSSGKDLIPKRGQLRCISLNV